MTPMEVPENPASLVLTSFTVSEAATRPPAGEQRSPGGPAHGRPGGEIIVKGTRFGVDWVLELRAFGEVEAEPTQAPYLNGLPQLSDELLALARLTTLTRADESRLLNEIDRIALLIREARQRWEAEQADEAARR